MDFFAIFNIIAGVASIASCVLAFFVYLKVDIMKFEIEKQTEYYKKQRNKIADNLNNFKIKVSIDSSIENRSGLRLELLSIKN
jgi:hypothetical protein